MFTSGGGAKYGITRMEPEVQELQHPQIDDVDKKEREYMEVLEDYKNVINHLQGKLEEAERELGRLTDDRLKVRNLFMIV